MCPDMSPRSESQIKKTNLYSHSHSFVLIRSAPKQRGCSSVRPLLQRVLVGLRHRFLPRRRPRRAPSLPAPLTCVAATCVARRGCSSVCPFPSACSSGCHVVPFPIASHAMHPRSRVTITCVARSIAIRPSPNAIGRAANPAMAAGAHVSWCLRSSSAKPRAPMSVAGVVGAYAPPLAVGSHPNDHNRQAPAFPSPILQMYVSSVSEVCCNCYIWMLQK